MVACDAAIAPDLRRHSIFVLKINDNHELFSLRPLQDGTWAYYKSHITLQAVQNN
jgi:hypothetical protein